MWPWGAFNFSLTATWRNECQSAHSCFLSWCVCPVQRTSAANLVKDSFPYRKCHLFSEVHTSKINCMINRFYVEGRPVYNGCPWKDGNCLDALALGDYLHHWQIRQCSGLILKHCTASHAVTWDWTFVQTLMNSLAIWGQWTGLQNKSLTNNHLLNLVRWMCESQAAVS